MLRRREKDKRYELIQYLREASVGWEMTTPIPYEIGADNETLYLNFREKCFL